MATIAQHIAIRLLAKYLLSATAQSEQRAGQSRTSSQATATVQNTSHSRQVSGDPFSPASNAAQTQFDIVNTPRPGYASPSAISTAILVSSCTKLFPILLVIWPTSSDSSTVSAGPFASRAASYIGWVVLINNIEALLILLDCGYIIATGLAVAGMIARFIIEGWLLALVGLYRDNSGPVGDVLSVLMWSRELIK